MIIFLAPLLGIVSIYFSYQISDVILRMYWDKYSQLEFHRKRYVVKNFVKGIYLSILTIFGSVVIRDAMFYGKWYNNAIKTLGVLYCLPDLIGLIKVPKLHKSTIFHHVTVCILSTINMFNDYESQDSIWKGMVIYAYISCLTGIVNHYLAYRLICDDENKDRRYFLALGAYNIYATSLLVNWLYQLYTVMRWVYHIGSVFAKQSNVNNFEEGIVKYAFDVSSHIIIPTSVLFVYIGLLYFIVVDDIILVKFLKKEMGRIYNKNNRDNRDKKSDSDISEKNGNKIGSA